MPGASLSFFSRVFVLCVGYPVSPEPGTDSSAYSSSSWSSLLLLMLVLISMLLLMSERQNKNGRIAENARVSISIHVHVKFLETRPHHTQNKHSSIENPPKAHNCQAKKRRHARGGNTAPPLGGYRDEPVLERFCTRPTGGNATHLPPPEKTRALRQTRRPIFRREK